MPECLRPGPPGARCKSGTAPLETVYVIREVTIEPRRTRLLLWLLLLACAGTLAELILLEHTETAWQWSPLVGLGLTGVLAGVLLIRSTPALLGALRIVASVLILFGVVGTGLHYQGNSEFELEMYPSRAGAELVWESLKGATPALAPGSLIVFGLIGFAISLGDSGARRPIEPEDRYTGGTG